MRLWRPGLSVSEKHCGSNETATGSDALASPPLISVAMIREFCVRYIQELEQHVGRIRLAGLWGERYLAEPAELLDLKKAGSRGSIQVLDPDATALGPAFFKKYADQSDLGLVMGLDANLIGSGSVAEIASRARTFIEGAGMAGRFVLFINDIPYDTPPENVRAAISVAYEYRANSSNTCYTHEHRDSADHPWPTIEEAARSVAEVMDGM